MELSDIKLPHLLLGGVVLSLLVIGFILLVSLKVLIAAGIMVVGFTMVWKTVWWIDAFGRNRWAEEHLTTGLGSGAGGSWLFYKLLGVATMILAFLYLTGGLQAILANILGVFFSSGTR